MPSRSRSRSRSRPRSGSPWPRRGLAALLLATSAALATNAALRDSVTHDETGHLTAGVSYWATGDFRLEPENPPLAKLWGTLPHVLAGTPWPEPRERAWRFGNVWAVGFAFLGHDAERLALPARLMNIVLLLATCALVWRCAHELFGARAGLLALALAALSPGLLAHGHVASKDVPVTFATLLTLWTAARLLQGFTPARLGWLALAFAAAVGIKHSWLPLLPALAAMGTVAALRARPLAFAGWPGGRAPAALVSRRARAAALLGAAALLVACAWLGLWAAYGFRYEPFRGPDAAHARMTALGTVDLDRATMADAWASVLHDAQGRPRTGPSFALLRFAREHRLLPEAYLYGAALVRAYQPGAYLLGRFYERGPRSFLPIALLLKTPIPTLLLVVVGLVVLARRRFASRDPALLVGLLTFALGFLAFAIAWPGAKGYRHALPAVAPLLALAGACAGGPLRSSARAALGTAVAWLALLHVVVHPHYLGYFNALVGGARNGHHYLLDSNLDWGQDMLRLRSWHAGWRERDRNPRPIKLAFFGSVDARRYAQPLERLPSTGTLLAPQAELGPGTWVVSVNQLLGLFFLEARDSYWKSERRQRRYAALFERFRGAAARPAGAFGAAGADSAADAAWQRYWRERAGRVLRGLAAREPDERLGTGLVVYHVSRAELDRLAAPQQTRGAASRKGEGSS